MALFTHKQPAQTGSCLDSTPYRRKMMFARKQQHSCGFSIIFFLDFYTADLLCHLQLFSEIGIGRAQQRSSLSPSDSKLKPNKIKGLSQSLVFEVAHSMTCLLFTRMLSIWKFLFPGHCLLGNPYTNSVVNHFKQLHMHYFVR